MLRFEVYKEGAPAKKIDLGGAYAFSQESIPIRAELAFSSGTLSVSKRMPGTCGLAVLWQAGDAGKYLLPTTRLLDRVKPYNLNVELARAQLTRIAQKREDWGMFDYANAEHLNRELDTVKAKLIDAMSTTDGAAASVIADEALEEGITLGEKMSLFHADVLLERRRNGGNGPARGGFGCMIDLPSRSEAYQQRLLDAFDFVTIPTAWKHIEPKERSHQFTLIDNWMTWAAQARKPVHAGPLVSFEQAHLPEWMYLWEHDYECLRDMIYEHVQKVVQRYDKQVRVWRVVGGLNAFNSFDLSFEQMIELTRLTCLLVKKLAPRSIVMIDLALPFGEYYARNTKTIPPLLYADMAVQSGIKFDAFGIQFCTGVPVDGMYVRDLLQISCLLDEFVTLSKPMHISACQVPSDVSADGWDAWAGQASVPKAGHWHNPWSQRLQAEWLQAFCRIALSKPYVESVCWRDLGDYEGHYIPHGGLCKSNMEPKLSFRELRNFKMSLLETDPTKREMK